METRTQPQIWLRCPPIVDTSIELMESWCKQVVQLDDMIRRQEGSLKEAPDFQHHHQY